ncbi:MAG: hypothetical protein Fur009_1270 [Candidatus Microgenomates bacterium]
MPEKISRRDFLKFSLLILSLFFLEHFIHTKKTEINPLYNLPYPPLNIYLPVSVNDPLIELFPQIEAILTNPESIFQRILNIDNQKEFSQRLKEIKFDEFCKKS